MPLFVRMAAVVAIVALTACAAPLKNEIPITQPQSQYRLEKTASHVAVVSIASGHAVLTVQAQADESQTTFSDGTVETIHFAELRTGRVSLGDGRTIQFPSPDRAVLYSADGQVLSSATATAGGITLTLPDGRTTFVQQPSSSGRTTMSLSRCQTDYLEYDLALAAEAAGALSLDPIAVALGFAGAELAYANIRNDCYQ